MGEVDRSEYELKGTIRKGSGCSEFNVLFQS